MPDTDSPSWPLTALGCRIAVHATTLLPALSPDIEQRVQSCWDEALRDHPRLYNGRVFSADRITPGRIDGHWTEFRRVFAQMRHSGLYGSKPLRPLAVVGLLHTRDGIVIGQRSHEAVYLPGWWQGAPAGNVESRTKDCDTEEIDLAAQLAAECEEELGVRAEECDIGACLLACEHPGSHIVDIGLKITIPLTFAALQERCATHGNAEYETLMLMRDGATAPAHCVPTLKAMLEIAS